MDSRLLRDAGFAELIQAACKRLGRNEALVLVDLSEDDPSSKDAWVILGAEATTIPRESIKAYGR